MKKIKMWRSGRVSEVPTTKINLQAMIYLRHKGSITKTRSTINSKNGR